MIKAAAVMLGAAALLTPVVAHAGATLQAFGGATSFGVSSDTPLGSATGDGWTAASRHAGPWNAAGALVGGAALPEAAPGTAGYRYTLVTPITLAAGQPDVAADRNSAGVSDAAAFGLAAAAETVFGTASAAVEPRLPVLDTVGTNGSSPVSGKFTFRTIASRLPEPATWILMILGFGAIGGLMRYQIRRSEARFTAKLRRIAAGETA